MVSGRSIPPIASKSRVRKGCCEPYSYLGVNQRNCKMNSGFKTLLLYEYVCMLKDLLSLISHISLPVLCLSFNCFWLSKPTASTTTNDAKGQCVSCMVQALWDNAAEPWAASLWLIVDICRPLPTTRSMTLHFGWNSPVKLLLLWLFCLNHDNHVGIHHFLDYFL